MENRYRLLMIFLLMVVGVPGNAYATVWVSLSSSAEQTQAASNVFDIKATTTGYSNKAGPFTLTVAVGWTSTCASGTHPIKKDKGTSFTEVNSSQQESVSKNGFYTWLGYAALEEGTYLCTQDVIGRVAEGATGVTNSGYNIVFQVGSLVQGHDTEANTFPIMKGEGECGTQ